MSRGAHRYCRWLQARHCACLALWSVTGLIESLLLAPAHADEPTLGAYVNRLTRKTERVAVVLVSACSVWTASGAPLPVQLSEHPSLMSDAAQQARPPSPPAPNGHGDAIMASASFSTAALTALSELRAAAQRVISFCDTVDLEVRDALGRGQTKGEQPGRAE